MAEAFIGRLSAIGLWKETTRGTKVAPKVWIPKTTGVLSPSFEVATDDSGYGVIDEVFDTITTKNLSKLSLEGIVRDNFIGYLLLGALGSYEKLKVFKGTVSGGTPKRGDKVAGGTATLRKIVKVGADLYYCFSGNVSGASITNWTWTLAATPVNNINAHFFSRANTNNLQTFTLYGDDPVASSCAPYSVINNLEISCEVADFVKFSAEFMGKQMQPVNQGEVTPAYADEPAFTASMAGVRFSDNEAGLNSATEVCMQNFRLAINKNITDIQCFGDTDVSAFYGQQLGIEGDFEAVYNDTTLRDYVINSSKKALRFYAENKQNGYSAMFIDVMKCGLNEWTPTDNNNELTKQTMGFSAQYDNASGTSIEVLLFNSNSQGY